MADTADLKSSGPLCARAGSNPASGTMSIPTPRSDDRGVLLYRFLIPFPLSGHPTVRKTNHLRRCPIYGKHLAARGGGALGDRP